MAKKPDKRKKRVVALLTRKELEFIDKLVNDALFSTGEKLTRAQVLSLLIDAAQKGDVSAQGLSDKEALVLRIIKARKAREERRKAPRFKKDVLIGFRAAESAREFVGCISPGISAAGASGLTWTALTVRLPWSRSLR